MRCGPDPGADNNRDLSRVAGLSGSIPYLDCLYLSYCAMEGVTLHGSLMGAVLTDPEEKDNTETDIETETPE